MDMTLFMLLMCSSFPVMVLNTDEIVPYVVGGKSQANWNGNVR